LPHQLGQGDVWVEAEYMQLLLQVWPQPFDGVVAALLGIVPAGWSSCVPARVAAQHAQVLGLAGTAPVVDRSRTGCWCLGVGFELHANSMLDNHNTICWMLLLGVKYGLGPTSMLDIQTHAGSGCQSCYGHSPHIADKGINNLLACKGGVLQPVW
jgi:hypothetical protein